MGKVLALGGLVALVLAALALRLWGIDRESLWLDEAVSVYYAGLGPSDIWALTFGREPNPPLYFLGLWAWMQMLGQSELAVRSLSALAGTLSLLPAYGIARRLGGRKAGLLAALATGASPYLLWYSQEARAFALLGLLSATLVYLTVLQHERRVVVLLALWAAVATLVLYTHFYGIFVVAASAPLLLANYRHRLAYLLPTLIVPVIVYLPWLAATLAANDPSQNWRATLGADDIFGRTLVAVAHNGVLSGDLASGTAAGLMALALLGLWISRWRSALLLGLVVLLPIVAGYLISLRQPIFSERYLIAVAIPAYVAASVGAIYVARRLRGFDVLVAIGVMALALHGAQSFRESDFGKENFRAAASFVAETASAEDVVIFVADYVQHPFAYYYRGLGRLVGFTGDPSDPGRFLQTAVEGARQVWLLESHSEGVDPEHRVREWLAGRFPLATEAFPRGIHLRAFMARYSLDEPPDRSRFVAASFGPLRLLGAAFPPSVVARDSVLHPPSNWLPVTLYWDVAEKPESDYRLLLQLVDPKGVWGVSMDRSGDVFNKVPTSSWPLGKTIVSKSDVNLNPAMAPGVYRLQAVLLDAEGQPVPVSDASGNAVAGPLPVGDVEIREGTR